MRDQGRRRIKVILERTGLTSVIEKARHLQKDKYQVDNLMIGSHDKPCSGSRVFILFEFKL